MSPRGNRADGGSPVCRAPQAETLDFAAICGNRREANPEWHPVPRSRSPSHRRPGDSQVDLLFRGHFLSLSDSCDRSPRLNTDRLWIPDAGALAETAADANFRIDDRGLSQTGPQRGTLEGTGTNTHTAGRSIERVAQVLVDVRGTHPDIRANRIEILAQKTESTCGASCCTEQLITRSAVAQHAGLPSRKDDRSSTLAGTRDDGQVPSRLLGKRRDAAIRTGIGASTTADAGCHELIFGKRAGWSKTGFGVNRAAPRHQPTRPDTADDRDSPGHQLSEEVSAARMLLGHVLFPQMRSMRAASFL